VAGKKLQSEDLRNWNISRNIIRAIKINMKWKWHVAYMGEMKNAYEFKQQYVKRRDQFRDVSLSLR
jgi:hypothetical protein